MNMVPRDADGKITLSWSQTVWGVATIATVIGCYFGVLNKIERIAYLVATNTARIDRIEERNKQAGFTQSDADEMRLALERKIEKANNGQ